MSKKSNKEVIETTRNKVAAQYSETVKTLRTRVAELESHNNMLLSKNEELTYKNEELTDKVRKQNEWIDRMHEFINMPKEEREREIETMKIKEENEKNLQWLLGFYSRYLHF